MWFLLMQVALAASPWADHNASIKVERTISSEPLEIYSAVDDLQELSQILPTSCVHDWALVGQTEGVGARGRVTYQLDKFRRRLTVAIVKAEPGRYVELDHLTSKGFISRWLFETGETGTVVSLETFLNPPPWPFKRYYFKNVHPAWLQCYEEALDNLEAKLSSD